MIYTKVHGLVRIKGSTGNSLTRIVVNYDPDRGLI
jgi:hypothetical protein